MFSPNCVEPDIYFAGLFTLIPEEDWHPKKNINTPKRIFQTFIAISIGYKNMLLWINSLSSVWAAFIKVVICKTFYNQMDL